MLLSLGRLASPRIIERGLTKTRRGVDDGIQRSSRRHTHAVSLISGQLRHQLKGDVVFRRDVLLRHVRAVAQILILRSGAAGIGVYLALEVLNPNVLCVGEHAHRSLSP